MAVISRIRQEIHVIGSDGGTLSSIAVPQVQAIFPQNALTKKIRVGLQAQPINLNNITKLIGHSVAVSSVVTVEPRRRKFHKAITLNMPAPRTHTKGKPKKKKKPHFYFLNIHIFEHMMVEFRNVEKCYNFYTQIASNNLSDFRFRGKVGIMMSP